MLEQFNSAALSWPETSPLTAMTDSSKAFRGKANFAGFAPTKAAQRILAEAIARELGLKGAHIAYVQIDAVIDVEWTRKHWPNAPDHFFITPAAIAEEVWHAAHQARCAWSLNVELGPFGETGDQLTMKTSGNQFILSSRHARHRSPRRLD